MKRILLLAITFFAIQMISAQATTKVANDSVHNIAGIEVKPDFPGGMGEFYKYFAKNYQTPNVKRLNGKVYVTFVIERDGGIVDIKVLRDIGYGTGEEAIRVLNKSPKWLPGEQDGKKVRCSFTLPITIDTR